MTSVPAFIAAVSIFINTVCIFINTVCNFIDTVSVFMASAPAFITGVDNFIDNNRYLINNNFPSSWLVSLKNKCFDVASRIGICINTASVNNRYPKQILLQSESFVAESSLSCFALRRPASQFW